MSENANSLQGSCRCGAVAFECSAPPMMTAACHCEGCRKMSSSAYSLSAIVPAPAFTVTRGEPLQGGAKGEEIRHFCCPDCMTWIFTRFPAMPHIVNIRPALLDDPRWTRPFIETQTAEKLDWVETPAVHSFERFPPEEAFQALGEEFARTFAAAG